MGWPTAKGRVVSSEVETFRVRRGTSYAPKVSYSFVVNGKTYLSDIVAFSALPSGAVEARQVVTRFSSGSEVNVHYSASNPEDSCLVPGEWSWRDLMPLLMGLVLAAAGGASTLEAARNRRSPSKGAARKGSERLKAGPQAVERR